MYVCVHAYVRKGVHALTKVHEGVHVQLCVCEGGGGHCGVHRKILRASMPTIMWVCMCVSMPTRARECTRLKMVVLVRLRGRVAVVCRE